VKSFDPEARVSSGFSTPRPAAEHLRRRPASQGGKPDWTQDSKEELFRNIAAIHRTTDIISVHVYPGQETGRFGSAQPVDIVRLLKEAADLAGKPLFIGEFGDSHIRQAAPGSFVDRTLDEIVALRIPYSALWAMCQVGPD